MSLVCRTVGSRWCHQEKKKGENINSNLELLENGLLPFHLNSLEGHVAVLGIIQHAESLRTGYGVSIIELSAKRRD